LSIRGYKTNPEEIQREAQNKNQKFHSFQAGRTIIRVLPPYSERGVWFKSISEYYIKLGDESKFLISPRDQGGRDPLAEFAEQLIRSGDEKLVQRGKEIRPRRRYLVNALVLNDSKGVTMKDGVKIVNLPVRVKDDLVNLDTDVQSGYGDITNLEKGFNIIVERQGDGLNTRYSVRAYRDPSNILQMAKEQQLDPDAWALHDLDAVSKASTEAELQAIVDRVKAGLMHAESPVGEVSHGPGGTSVEPRVTHTQAPSVGVPRGLDSFGPPPPGFETR